MDGGGFPPMNSMLYGSYQHITSSKTLQKPTGGKKRRKGKSKNVVVLHRPQTQQV